MKSIKKTAEYTIYQKRNNRYAVKSANGQWLNGDDKVTVLVAESLIKLSVAAPVEAPVEEAPAAEEAPAEETKED
ncbi:MAG: hypothetical protein HOO01_04910 [Cellvibrionales bacterium]|nr:hypothetical protein [Cellvibrionales bacterium]